MTDFTNIPAGLNITTQIPLNVKTFKINEAELMDLGLNNNLAYTYHDGLKVYCLDSRKTYEWRERKINDNDGLLLTDFTYPNNVIAFGVTYSNKIFNFFKINYVYSQNLKGITSPNHSVNIIETSTEIQLSVNFPTVEETKIINGLETTVTGIGTILNPYIINGKIYQAGSNINITGLGTSISPYVISVNTSLGNIGWLTGDTKEIVCTKDYMFSNFDSTGLGTNERLGWAIMNGNHAPDDTGLVVVGYGGLLYQNLGAIGGEKDHQLTLEESVKHRHDIASTEDVGGDPNPPNLNTYGNASNGAYLVTNQTSLVGGETLEKEGTSKPHNNMQPYVVRLRIMKL